jgi:DNA-binding transcriptional LysR family regulator
MSTIVSLVARGLGIAFVPRLAVAAADRRIAVRDLPHGLDLARDVYAVARTASVRRPSVAVIVTALRAAGPSRPRTLNPFPLGWPGGSSARRGGADRLARGHPVGQW